MSKIDGVDLESVEEDFKRNLYILLLFYRQLIELLEIFFSGDLLINDDELNIIYLKICYKIEKILENQGFENLKDLEWKPFKRLIFSEEDYAKEEWEYLGKMNCYNFINSLEDIFIRNGENKYPLDAEDQKLLDYIKDYIIKYYNYKKNYEKKWLNNIENNVNKLKQNKNKHYENIKEFSLEFIQDEEIKNLLIKDWKEAIIAFKNRLFKAPMYYVVQFLKHC